MERTIALKCPHCNNPLPKKFGEVEIKDTDQFVGLFCPSCNNEFTEQSAAAIEKQVKDALEQFKKDALSKFLKDAGFKPKQ